MPRSVLIIEDETLLGQELARHYRKIGYDVEWVKSLSQAKITLIEQRFDPNLVLSDMNLPDGNALDFMEKVKSKTAFAEWLFLTGFGSVPDSVRALRLGAYDFLEKPCDLERLDLIVASAVRSAKAQRQLSDQAENLNRRFPIESYVGQSKETQHIRVLLKKLTEVPLSALIISGETGTGKGLAAKILHYNGFRAQGPLIEINCAALPRDIMESELFGHEAGAFTGANTRHRGMIEQADGGTLFLDEIGEMPLDLQAKLLKALEDKKIRRLGSEREIPVDTQIIAASNRDLEIMSENKEFRDDLYHRLSVFKLSLPPLRSIKQDLQVLVPILIAEFNAKSSKNVNIIPDPVWDRFYAYDWPGNVRELRNLIERCVLFSNNEVFPIEWLQLPGDQTSNAKSIEAERNGIGGVTIPLDGSMSLDDMDRFIIQKALERSDFNITGTARALGTTRETLRYRIRKYGLDTNR